LEEVVNQMPKKLKDLYARTMTRIEPLYLREGFAMMQVILYCQIPLSLTQLMRIIDTSFLAGLIGGHTSELHQSINPRALLQSSKQPIATTEGVRFSDKTEPPQNSIAMARRLASRSGGLLEIAPGDPADAERTVQFLHQTVKEFARTYLPSGITGPIGCELLLHQSCVDPDKQIDLVGSDVLYYAKAFELLAKRSSRPYLMLLYLAVSAELVGDHVCSVSQH
jgi:hypothetical protein